MFVGSMMMPEPIMLIVTMNVSCTTFIFFFVVWSAIFLLSESSVRVLASDAHHSTNASATAVVSRQRGVRVQSDFGKGARRPDSRTT